MKKNLFVLGAIVLLSSIIFSCSMENRMHLSGYHVDWKKNKEQNKSNIAKNSNKSYNPIESKISISEHLTASTDSTIPDQEVPQKKIVTIAENDTLQHSKCDTLFLKNGTKILAKVTEIGLNTISYKYCNNVDGPSIVVAKSKTESIVYKNGSKETFLKEEIPADIETKNNDNANQKINKKFEWFGLYSFITGLVGMTAPLGVLDVFDIPIEAGIISLIFIGLAAIGLGIYSLYKTTSQKGVYKRNAFSILGIVFGAVVTIVVALVYLLISALSGFN